MRTMLFLLCLADRLLAPASRKLCEQTRVGALVVHDGINRIKRTCASALQMSAFGGKADMTFLRLQMSAYDPKRTFKIISACTHKW